MLQKLRLVTSGINTAGLIGAVVVSVAVLAALLYWQRAPLGAILPIGTDQGRTTLPDPGSPGQTDTLATSTDDRLLTTGVYQSYSPERLAAVPFDASALLFFTNSRCASCQTFIQDVREYSDEIPFDVHILAVPYDDELTLRRQYGVRVPHTFVLLNTERELVDRWTGSLTLNSALARLRATQRSQ